MNHIIAILPHQPVKLITKRQNAFEAKIIAQNLQIDANRQRIQVTFRFVPSGLQYCNQCGKCSDWNSPNGCKAPANLKDWHCTLSPVGVTAR